MIDKKPIPLVRLGLILPFVQELDRRRIDTDAVLSSNGLIRAALHDARMFVPPMVIHRFLEDAAQAAGDPFLGIRVGESLDWSSWPPMLEAANKARNLVGFLVRFIRAASNEASSAVHQLEAGPEYTLFRERRTSEQKMAPSQNDAFTAAFTLGLLHRAAGPSWKPGQVRLTVCSIQAVPDRYMGVHILGGDRMGISVRFPTAWLLEPFNRHAFLGAAQEDAAPGDLPEHFLDALQYVIAPRLHGEELGLETIAHWVGMSPQSLQRKLRAGGTTLSAVIRNLRKTKAEELLRQTNRPIGEIASELGYTNPTSFTRAFNSWTGRSPRAYRKKYANP